MTHSDSCPACKARKDWEIANNIPQEIPDTRIYLDILPASQFWLQEKKIPDKKISFVFYLLFYSLSALHNATMRLSLRSVSGMMKHRPPTTTSDSITFSMFANSKDYANFRSMLALTGDVYFILGALNYDLKELTPKIKKLYDEADKFRDLRNFFTHFENIIKDPARHGVSGPCKTNCGIEYTANTTNGFHLVLDSDTFYFTYENKAHEVFFGKSAFNEIFLAGREIYREIINAEFNKTQNYPDPESIFPLNDD